MPINNEIYNRFAEDWRNEESFLHLLSVLNPARFNYLRQVLTNRLRIDLRGKKTLDIGCGGGLLAEEFAAIGCAVFGIDPSAPSIAAASAHAAEAGLDIDYTVAAGEKLPFDDHFFDIVYCCDVLEHVDKVNEVIGEASRVLKPGGVFLYDTLNRTVASWIITNLLQDWAKIMPRDTHVWSRFIKPAELDAIMTRFGLANQEAIGLGPSANPIKQGWEFLRVLRGKLSFPEAFLRMRPAAIRSKMIMYMGFALRGNSGPSKNV